MLNLPYQTYVHMNMAFLLAYPFIFIPGIILYIYFRNAELIRKRGYFLSLFQSVMAAICFLFPVLDSYYIGCFPMLFIGVCLIPCWIYPYFFRSYILWFNARSAKETVYQNAILSKGSAEELLQTNPRIASWFLSKKWTIKMSSQIVFIVVTFILSLTLALLMYFFDPFVWPDDIREDFSITIQQRCNTKSTLAVTIAEGAIAYCGLLFSMVLLWKEDDQLRFKKELKVLTIIGAIYSPLWIAATMVPSWPPIIRAVVLCEFCIVLFFSCTIIWPVVSVYQRSRVTMKEKKECVNESQIDALELCLQHDIFYKSFEKFAMKSWCIENLYFYEKTTEYLNLPASSIEEEAKLIWASFLQSCAPFEINIDSSTRGTIEKRMEANDIKFDTFEEARTAVFTLLRYSTFPLWKNSIHFQNALKKSGLKSIEELANKSLSRRKQRFSYMQIEEAAFETNF